MLVSDFYARFLCSGLLKRRSCQQASSVSRDIGLVENYVRHTRKLSELRAAVIPSSVVIELALIAIELTPVIRKGAPYDGPF